MILAKHCILRLLWVLVGVYMYEHICQVVCVEAREQPVGVHFLISPFSTSRGLNSGGQAWWQEPLPTQPSRPLFLVRWFEIGRLSRTRLAPYSLLS